MGEPARRIIEPGAAAGERGERKTWGAVKFEPQHRTSTNLHCTRLSHCPLENATVNLQHSRSGLAERSGTSLSTHRSGPMKVKNYAELDDFYALKLLVALADDQVDGHAGFRSLFQTDPRAALAAIGVPEAQADSGCSDGIWSSLQVQQLAAPDVIRGSARRLLGEITQARAAANPHTLDVVRAMPVGQTRSGPSPERWLPESSVA